ncbi:MAG: chromosome segregation protein SMC [Lachnospiraceae bacterium]|nr:chromosome segregation protein SMC [Lachnospiraceae bacterium]
MYLKRIEVQGFKSFANKITFQFHNGITGIVGPNGSGKSNVADAVRWVLGEQRIKQLRGASMQDVIFSGTESRKPLSYAYVAITLDNSDHQLAIDYDEVTVARRLYRSGESEYLINGASCRLKDVNELFYDTGIGKEGYSIIGQGQIDRILSGKPEEKRELFDEAAGIVKFKRRKATAQKKLEEEKQNLIRVNDILSELEKQIGPLERQSDKAKIYLKKKEELKTLDVNVFLLENTRIKELLGKVEEDLQVASQELESSNSTYRQIKEEYDQIQTRLGTLEEEIEQTRSSLTDTSVLRGKLEGEIKVLQEQINFALSNAEHLKQRQSQVQTALKEKEGEQQAILELKEAIDEDALQAGIKKEEAGSKLALVQKQIETINHHIETGKNTIIDALNERATIKSQMERYDTMLEQVQIRKAELTSRLVSVKSDEEKQEHLIQNLEDEFQKIQEKITALNHAQAKKEEELDQIREELSGQDQALRDTQVKYHQEKSRLDALSNLTERYEGYGGSVKRVMEQREEEAGIIGVVADIIKVDKQYETAIETALGGNIQNIVTEDEETAKKMISFLKAHKAGRATFLPLTSTRNPQEFKTPQVLEEKGVVGMAHELVKVEPRYSNVAKAMLGRIVVVDHVDHAVKIARKYGYGIRMVTLEGELLVPGGAISGGAFKNNSNLLGRRREMEELGRKVKDYLKQVDDLLNGIEATKEKRNRMRLELEQIKAGLQEEFIHQNTARLNVIAARKKQDETHTGADSLMAEVNDSESQLAEIMEGKQRILKELETSQELEKNSEKQIGEFQLQLEELRRQESEHTALVSEQEVEVEKILQRKGFEQQNLDRVNAEVERFRTELAEIVEGIGAKEEEIEFKQQSIVQLNETIAASHTSQSDAETVLKDKLAAKEELSLKQKNFFATREEMAEKITRLDKETYRLTSQKERHQEAIQSQIDYMWNEYEITLHDAASMRNDELTDLTVMKRDVGALKDEIRRLGDVNVNAIEDFKNLMERYGFLKNQHDDLVEAEKTLLEIIEELDTAMRKQFKEKFAQISREFDKVFKELFGGGKGTLELMEEEDILEAGIRIIAQPPGKKLQNMMQLSGGEKALTAIALLFAIQNLKPSPFCLLDEIEAALDENNVARYAKYLHKLTKYTQFIVITHRRGTMERADRLYGITMQEKGVSTLVSVNLIEQELDK